LIESNVEFVVSYSIAPGNVKLEVCRAITLCGS
jgi:hypothetical protein